MHGIINRKDIKTFSHHKHEEGKILPCHRTNIDEIIEEIEERLEKV